MQELYRIKPLKMLAWWVLCSLFIFPLTMIVLAFIGLPTVYLLSVIFPNFYYSPSQAAMTIIAVPAIGAVIGFCIAFLQRWILRTKLYWAADRWFLWTVIGGAVGASVTMMVFYFWGNALFYGETDGMLSAMPIFLGIVSIFQFIALRHAVKQAWLWIIANIIGGIVFAGVALNNQPSYTSYNYGLISIAVSFFAVVALGFITGFVLLFLFEKKMLPMRPENEEDVLDKKPKSVWDRAI